MDISIFGYKLNLEILILIGVVYLILVGHTLCGCSNYSLMEGLDMMKDVATGNATVTAVPAASPVPEPAGALVAGKAKNGAAKPNGKSGKEGFVGANTNYGQSSPFDLTSNTMVDTSSWSRPDLTVVPGKPLNPAVKQFLNRKQQQLPLPEGEMDFFVNVEFKPECCPNAYSNSSGCACMTSKDYNFLKNRGSNNVPYSEY